MLNLTAAGGSAGGMLDRTRMALCAFTFFFLSLNPLATLFFSSGSRSPAEGAASGSVHHAGRTMLNVDIAGTNKKVETRESLDDHMTPFTLLIKMYFL